MSNILVVKVVAWQQIWNDGLTQQQQQIVVQLLNNQ